MCRQIVANYPKGDLPSFEGNMKYNGYLRYKSYIHIYNISFYTAY